MEKDVFLGLNHWAVVGDVTNPQKFAAKIVTTLTRHGFKVSRVNPRGGENVSTSLADLPQKPDVVCLVINPAQGIDFVQEAAGLDINYLWLQPGADTDDVVAKCRELGVNYVRSCVLVELSLRDQPTDTLE